MWYKNQNNWFDLVSHPLSTTISWIPSLARRTYPPPPLLLSCFSISSQLLFTMPRESPTVPPNNSVFRFNRETYSVKIRNIAEQGTISPTPVAVKLLSNIQLQRPSRPFLTCFRT